MKIMSAKILSFLFLTVAFVTRPSQVVLLAAQLEVLSESSCRCHVKNTHEVEIVAEINCR